MCTAAARGFAAATLVAAALVMTARPVAAQTTAGPFSAPQLTIQPVGATVVTVAGRPYHGAVVLGADGPAVAVVNRVPFEQYVDGIAEMPSNWPRAALEAQAVAARTYALWQILTHPAGPAGGQICATDACQVYAGMSKEEGPDGSNWDAAVGATQGQVLLYGGRVIEALYGSSDGGQTVYGGVSWLPSVSDPQDSLSPEHQWSWTEPLNAMAPILGVPAQQTLTTLVSSTTAITATLQDAGGSTSTLTFSPDQFHTVLNSKMAPPAGLDLPLPSGRFSVSTYGADVKVAGYGDGNGLGLSQYGALGKAQAGWSAGQILANYYGTARPSGLPAGEEPATIGVTLLDQAGQVTIGATGPAQILDQSGRQVGATSGPESWAAGLGPGGVALQPVSSSAVDSPDMSRDLAPIPTRQTAAVGAAAPAPAPQAPAPTTTSSTLPPASIPPPPPSASPTANALGSSGPVALSSHGDGAPWLAGLGGLGALGSVCAGGTVFFRRRHRSRQPGSGEPEGSANSGAGD